MIRNRFFSFVLFSSLVLLAACDSDSTDPAPEQGGGAGGVAGTAGAGGDTSKGGEGGSASAGEGGASGEGGEAGAPGEKTASTSQAVKKACSPSPQTLWTGSGYYGATHWNECNAQGKTIALHGATTVIPNQSEGCVCRMILDGGTHCGILNGVNGSYPSAFQWTCTTNLTKEKTGGAE